MTHQTTPETRESDIYLNAVLCQEVEAVGFSHAIPSMLYKAVLAAMRRISTPIPLTPSDGEIVERLMALANPAAERMSEFQRINSFVEVAIEAAQEITRLRSSVQAPITPSDEMVAALLNGLEPKDCDGGWGASGVRNVLSEPHSGDCTKEPWSCGRCHVEQHRGALQAALNFRGGK